MTPARRLVLPILLSLFLISSFFTAKQALALWVFDFDPPGLCLTFDQNSGLPPYCPVNPIPQTPPLPPIPILITSNTTATFTCDDGITGSGCQSLTYTIHFFTQTGEDLAAKFEKTCKNDDPCDTDRDPQTKKIVVNEVITPAPNHTMVQIDYNALDNAGNKKVGDLHYNFNFYPYKISGFIWIDDNGNGSQQPQENSCYTGSATIVLTGPLSTNKTFNFSRATPPCETYTFNIPAGSYTVDLSLTGWTVTASPPTIATPPDKTDANFGVTVRTWWQTKLGDVRAATGKLDDVIPSFCTLPQCQPFVSLTGDNSAGIVSAATTFSLGAGETSSSKWKVLDTFSNPTVYAYEYMKSRTTPTGTFDGSRPSSSGVYTTTGPVTLDGPSWNTPVPAGTKITILVAGNLTINRNVKVDQGGFLAFYVKDDILVDPSIGTNFNNSTNFNLEGIYIADGSFKTGELESCSVGNNRLNVAGTIVIDANADGIGNLAQERCLTAQQSQRYPAFYVDYRPNFLLSAPPIVQQSSFVWQEIAP